MGSRRVQRWGSSLLQGFSSVYQRESTVQISVDLIQQYEPPPPPFSLTRTRLFTLLRLRLATPPPPPLPLLPHSHPPVYSLTTPFEQVFAIIVALTAQLAIAWGAYATLGVGVEDDLLEVHPETGLITAARVCVSMLVTSCYPLQVHFPVFNTISFHKCREGEVQY